MPVAQSPAHYINSSKGCPSITESFPLCCLLEHKMLLSPPSRTAITPIGLMTRFPAASALSRHKSGFRQISISGFCPLHIWIVPETYRLF
jgi:hypothetical protein